MTGLLISVRDAEEAATALTGGADLVDIKEPSRGSLGAASPSAWREVLAVCGSPKMGLAPGHGCPVPVPFSEPGHGCPVPVPFSEPGHGRPVLVPFSEPGHGRPVPVPFSGRVPTSVALGELLDTRADWDFELLAHFQFAKLGLAGCERQPDWGERWGRALRSLPPTVASVAVVYADWQQCQAPPPREIIRRAAGLSCKAVLFDTYAKAGGNLFSHLPSAELGQLVAQIRDAGLLVVLGGSLAGDAIDQACVFEPDYIAVRGAACRGARTDQVDLQLVRRLAEQVRRANS